MWPQDEGSFCGWELLKLSHHCRKLTSCDITWPHDQRDIRRGNWEFLDLSHHFVKLDGYRYCRDGEFTFFILSCDIKLSLDQISIWLAKWKALKFRVYSSCGTGKKSWHVTTFDKWWRTIGLCNWEPLIVMPRSVKRSHDQMSMWLGKQTPVRNSPLCQVWGL